MKKRFERRLIQALKPHPKNEKCFANLSDAEINLLAEDMKKNGLNTAIDVLPDGTVIAGHQRLRAAKLLSWPDIRCRVRYDLADASEATIEALLLRDNLHRRQLSKLDAARAYQRLREIERGKRGNDRVAGDVRDYVGQRFGVSGRTLDRWVRLLRLPIELQHAVSADQLPAAAAAKLLELPTKTQRSIAAQIRAGSDPKTVVNAAIKDSSKATKELGTAVAFLIRNLKASVTDLDGRTNAIRNPAWRKDLPLLRRGKLLLSKVIFQIEAIDENE